MLNMENVCQCVHCDSYIEYDSSDIRITGDFLNFTNVEYYIVCPECGHSIILADVFL